MNFNHAAFKKQVKEKYSHLLAEDIINELLDLEDGGDYSGDIPKHTGKRLILLDLSFKGEKSDGKKIDFHQKFQQGVNIWIADNLKGKSSIFKIIQFALTGNDKLKGDIKNG